MKMMSELKALVGRKVVRVTGHVSLRNVFHVVALHTEDGGIVNLPIHVWNDTGVAEERQQPDRSPPAAGGTATEA